LVCSVLALFWVVLIKGKSSFLVGFEFVSSN